MPRHPARLDPRAGRILILACISTLLLPACGTAAPELTAAPGASSSSSTSGRLPPAPVFQVTLFDGKVFDLATHLSRDGRPVLLNLWASWCPPCRREMPLFDDAARRHPQVLFLGVAVRDDPQAAAAAVQELEVAYPLGADLDGTLDAAFPSPGLPATFLIDGDGTLLGAVYGGLGRQDIEDLVARYLGG